MKSFLPLRRSDLESREVDEELLVLDRREGRIHKFNHSAALIFGCCDGRHTIEQIIDRVAAEYGKAAEAVRQDVDGALRHFAELGLLTTTFGDSGE